MVTFQSVLSELVIASAANEKARVKLTRKSDSGRSISATVNGPCGFDENQIIAVSRKSGITPQFSGTFGFQGGKAQFKSIPVIGDQAGRVLELIGDADADQLDCELAAVEIPATEKARSRSKKAGK